MQRNAYLLDLLKKQDKSGKQIIDLDIDDYLNPQLTIEAYQKGIDMAFMVRHLGGSYMVTESDDAHETEYNFDDSQ